MRAAAALCLQMVSVHITGLQIVGFFLLLLFFTHSDARPTQMPSRASSEVKKKWLAKQTWAIIWNREIKYDSPGVCHTFLHSQS